MTTPPGNPWFPIFATPPGESWVRKFFDQGAPITLGVDMAREASTANIVTMQMRMAEGKLSPIIVRYNAILRQDIDENYRQIKRVLRRSVRRLGLRSYPSWNRRRASKGYRKHVRRMKAARRRA